jgi:nitroreductase
LPEPQREGGDGVFGVIERRASGTRNDFPNGAVSDSELSAILWAASGLNRGGKGWTVPFAGGKSPYVKIFAVRKDGAFLYDWKGHSLAEITPENILDKITGDGFARNASCVLVFVSAPDDLGSMADFNRNGELAYIASGAMTQNAYLAAEALGVSGRYMISMKTDAVKSELRLKTSERPLCIMPLGKR